MLEWSSRYRASNSLMKQQHPSAAAALGTHTDHAASSSSKKQHYNRSQPAARFA